MKKILTCLLAVLGLTSACGQGNFGNTDVEGFAELIADSSVVVLDVRTAAEFADGHIQGAILIDQNQSDFVEKAKATLPPTRPLQSIAEVVAVLPMPQESWVTLAISV